MYIVIAIIDKSVTVEHTTDGKQKKITLYIKIQVSVTVFLFLALVNIILFY